MNEESNEKAKAAGATGGGVATGAAAYAVVGKMGIVAMGGGVSLGLTAFAIGGGVLGLAGYGLYRALKGNASRSTLLPESGDKKPDSPNADMP